MPGGRVRPASARSELAGGMHETRRKSHEILLVSALKPGYANV